MSPPFSISNGGMLRDHRLQLLPKHIDYLARNNIPQNAAVSFGISAFDRTGMGVVLGLSTRATNRRFLPTQYGLGVPYSESLDYWRLRLDNPPNPKMRFLVERGIVRMFMRCISQADCADTSRPIYIVESPIKAIGLFVAGLPVIGLNGITTAHDPAALRRGEFRLRDDFDIVSWKGRHVAIVPDANWRWNPNVRSECGRIARCLWNAGARPWIVHLPPIAGTALGTREADQGPAEFISAFGRESFNDLVRTSSQRWVPPAVRPRRYHWGPRGDVHLEAFIRNYCVTGPDLRTNPSDLFDAYSRWLQHQEIPPASQTSLSIHMQLMGFERGRSHGKRFYRGIALKQSCAALPPLRSALGSTSNPPSQGPMR